MDRFRSHPSGSPVQQRPLQGEGHARSSTSVYHSRHRAGGGQRDSRHPVTPSLPGIPVEQLATRLPRLPRLSREYSGEPAHRWWPTSRTTSRWPYRNMRTPSGRPAGRRGAGMDSPGRHRGERWGRSGPDGVEGTADDLYAKGGPAVGIRNPPTATPGVGTTATGRRWPRLAKLSSRRRSPCPSTSNCRLSRRPSSSLAPASIASSSVPTYWVTWQAGSFSKRR